MPPTNKRKLRARLEKENRWEEFKNRKVALRLEGLSAQAAQKQAEEEFGPLTPEYSVEDSIAGVSKAPGGTWLRKDQFAGKGKTGIREAVEWAFENIDVQDVGPLDAPSPGAWSLLRWVRRAPAANQGAFYTTFVRPLLPTKSQLDMEDPFADDGRSVLSTIERLLAQHTSVPPPRPQADREKPVLATDGVSGSD